MLVREGWSGVSVFLILSGFHERSCFCVVVLMVMMFLELVKSQTQHAQQEAENEVRLI